MWEFSGHGGQSQSLGQCRPCLGKGNILVSQGCFHQLPQTGWLKTEVDFLTVLEAGGLKSRCQQVTDCSSSLPASAGSCLHIAVFPLCLDLCVFRWPSHKGSSHWLQGPPYSGMILSQLEHGCKDLHPNEFTGTRVRTPACLLGATTTGEQSGYPRTQPSRQIASPVFRLIVRSWTGQVGSFSEQEAPGWWWPPYASVASSCDIAERKEAVAAGFRGLLRAGSRADTRILISVGGH